MNVKYINCRTNVSYPEHDKNSKHILAQILRELIK